MLVEATSQSGSDVLERGRINQQSGAAGRRWRPGFDPPAQFLDAAALVTPPASFAWPDRAHLPYAYALDPVDFTRTHLDRVGTIVPVDETDRALLRSYLPMTGPFTPAPPPVTTFALTTAASGAGTVVVDPNLPAYEAGSTVTLTAVPDPGWQLVGWSGDLAGNVRPAW